MITVIGALRVQLNFSIDEIYSIVNTYVDLINQFMLYCDQFCEGN